MRATEKEHKKQQIGTEDMHTMHEDGRIYNEEERNHRQ
jgi:hypothetical protein